jgi:hypothetical protein
MRWQEAGSRQRRVGLHQRRVGSRRKAACLTWVEAEEDRAAAHRHALRWRRARRRSGAARGEQRRRSAEVPAGNGGACLTEIC